jgi:hypothetical protein
MTGDELVDYVRQDLLHDTAVPHLWSNELILKYLVEAENLFARITHALLDNTSTTAELSLIAGEPNYALSKRVVMVNGALVEGQSCELKNYTRRFIPTQLVTATGTPQIFAMNEAAHTLRVYPVPEVDGVLKLRITRLPLEDLKFDTTPEIPEQYHIDLGEYAAYRCLKNSEVDGSNLGSSAEFYESWTARVSLAKSEYYRMRMGPDATARNNWTGKRN